MKLKTPQKILIFTISFSLTFNSLFFTILNVNAQTSGVSKLPAPGLNDNAVAGAGDLGSSANSVSSPVGGGLPVYDEAANQTLFGILQSVTAVDYSSGITAGNTGVVAAETSALTTKETVLDIAVWGTINALLRQLTATTINWINSGFEGSPMYVQDLEQFLTDRANVIATEFINNLGDKMGQKLTSMPYSSDVQYALRLDASSRGGQMIPTLESNQYNDLTGGGSNGFSKGGGWNAWYQLTQNPGNNPMEVYLAAKSAMENAIQNDQNNQKEQLDWGEGFFSWRKCEQYSVPGVDSYNDMTPEEQSDARQNSPSTCTKWGPVQTPGTTIKDQLNEHLSEDLQRIGLATELGQIVDAFLAEMAKKALSSAGLSGKGDSSSGGGGMGSYGNIGDWLDPDAFSQLTSNEECNSQNDAMDKIKSIIDPIMSNMSQSKPQAQNFDPKVIIKTIFLLGASIIQDVHERQQGNENPTNFQETIKGVINQLAGSFMGGQLITDTFGKQFNNNDSNPNCKNFDGTNNTTDTTEVTGTPILNLNGEINITMYPSSRPFVDPGVTLADTNNGGSFDWVEAQKMVLVNNDPFDPDHPEKYVNTSRIGTYFITYTYKNEETGLSANPQMRVVNVIQDKSPVVTLTGDTITYAPLGVAYTDPGATAIDYLGNDITSKITNEIYESSGKKVESIDTNSPGAYAIFYKVKNRVDEKDLENPQTYRIVIVSDVNPLDQ